MGFAFRGSESRTLTEASKGLHEPRPDLFKDLAGIGQQFGLCLLVGSVTGLQHVVLALHGLLFRPTGRLLDRFRPIGIGLDEAFEQGLGLLGPLLGLGSVVGLVGRFLLASRHLQVPKVHDFLGGVGIGLDLFEVVDRHVGIAFLLQQMEELQGIVLG